MTLPSSQRLIADFVIGDVAITSEMRQLARDALFDTLAVSFAGAREAVSRQTLDYVRQSGGRGDAPFWTFSDTGAAEQAALLNGVVAHALDYDDVSPSWRGHGSAVMFPAITAVGPNHSIDNILDAYVVGFEVGARLGRAVIATHYPRGWHATATIGIIAATAAVCRLVGAKREVIENGLGLAVAQAAGVQANFGTTAKPLHAGFAAMGAVRALALAQAGIASSNAAIDGRTGFAGLYAENPDIASKFTDVGTLPFAITAAKLERKHYPMCYAAHRAVAAVMRLHAKHTIDAGNVASISVESSKGSHDPLLDRLPNSPDEAKFSLEFNVAAAMIDRAISLNTFTDAALTRDDIRSLAMRTTIKELKSDSGVRWSRVSVKFKDGSELAETAERLDSQSGFETDPVFRAKIADCLKAAGTSMDPRLLYGALTHGSRPVASLFELDDVRQLRTRLTI